MHANYFFQVFNTNKSKIALIWNNNEYTYGALYKKIVKTSLLIKNHNINTGSVSVYYDGNGNYYFGMTSRTEWGFASEIYYDEQGKVYKSNRYDE